MANWPTGLNGYSISDMDTTSDPKYFGYMDDSGEWYIMKMTTSSEFRYVRGSTDYSTNWTNRASLSYDLYGTTF